MSFFDILNDINTNKQYNFDEKEYNAFMINRGLSNFSDTILLASEMNKYHDIPKQWQYDFLFHAVTKKKRIAKWAKKEKSSEDIKVVSEYYSCNNYRANEILNILSETQLDDIRAALNKGGR